MGSYDDGRKSLENTHILICRGRHTLMDFTVGILLFFFFFYRAALAKAYQTAAVLFDVLKAVNRDKTEEPPPEVSFKTGIHYTPVSSSKGSCVLDDEI